MRIGRYTPAIALSAILLGSCTEPMTPESAIPVVKSFAVLVPPSGYTAIDLTPSLPPGMSANALRINDAGQVIISERDIAAGISTFYLWDGLTKSSYGEVQDGAPFNINNLGQAAGWLVTGPTVEAARWDGTVPTPLGLLGGLHSSAYDINESGQVTGVAILPGQQLVRWDGGVATVLGAPGGGFDQATGRHINASGEMIGRTFDSSTQRGFFWSGGTFTVIHPPAGGTSLSLAAPRFSTNLNDNGEFFGTFTNAAGDRRGFFWSGGVLTAIPTFGGDRSSPSSLNQAGEVVGGVDDAMGNSRAFRWSGGVMTDLGTLGGSESVATGINDAGQVVGSAETAAGEVHAYVWDAGAMTDVGTLGGSSSAVNSINASGEFVGSASTAADEGHAVLWRPATTTEAVESTKDLVDQLLAAAVLTPAQAAALQAILDDILDDILDALAAVGMSAGQTIDRPVATANQLPIVRSYDEADDARRAYDLLGDFIDTLHEIFDEGGISLEDAEILRDWAAEIQAELRSGAI